MHLDPHLEAEVVTNMICLHFFDPLVFMDSNMKVVPCVAVLLAVPQSRHLDFQPPARHPVPRRLPELSAEDVVFSIERVRDHPAIAEKTHPDLGEIGGGDRPADGPDRHP